MSTLHSYTISKNCFKVISLFILLAFCLNAFINPLGLTKDNFSTDFFSKNENSSLKVNLANNAFLDSFSTRDSLKGITQATLEFPDDSFDYSGISLSGWPIYSGSTGFSSSPMLADIDGDDKPEIIAVAYNGSVFAFNEDTSQVSGWPVHCGDDTHSGSGGHMQPTIGDVDADGAIEIVFALSNKNSVFILNHDGTDLSGWPKNIGTNIPTGLTLYDLDNDGDLEILGGGADNKVYIWHHDGTNYGSWPFTTPTDQIWSQPNVCDLDNDGEPEILFNSNDNKFYVLNLDKSAVNGWPWSASNGDPQAGIAVADVDDDNRYEVFFPSHGNRIYGLNHDGTALSGWPKTLSGYGPRGVSIGDLNNDGTLEIVFGDEDGTLYVCNPDGSDFSGWPKQPTANEPIGVPALVDLNNDDNLDIITGSWDGHLYAWNYDGTVVAGWPKNYGEPVAHTQPAVGDIDGDGLVEVILGTYGSSNSQLWAFDTAGIGEIPSEQFGYNFANTGRAQDNILAWHTSAAPTIDGAIGGGEWENAKSYTTSFMSNEDTNNQQMTFRVMHDGSYLYIALESTMSDGSDSRAAVLIDGNRDGVLDGSASAPYQDVKFQQAAPSGSSSYSGYWYLLPTSETEVTPPSGSTAASSLAGSYCHYEWKIPLSDLTISTGDAVGLAITVAEDAVDEYSYPNFFWKNNARPVWWSQLTIVSESNSPSDSFTITVATPSVTYDGGSQTIDISGVTATCSNPDHGELDDMEATTHTYTVYTSGDSDTGITGDLSWNSSQSEWQALDVDVSSLSAGDYYVKCTFQDADAGPKTSSASNSFTIGSLDSDGDGLTDAEETDTYGTDPNDADSDDDGLEDGEEVNTHNTNPNDTDSDDDGLDDQEEVTSGSDGYQTDPNDSDSDDDGLTDSEEQTHSTDPTDADSDDDSYDDGEEVAAGTNPNDDQDYPGTSTTLPETTTPPESDPPSTQSSSGSLPNWAWGLIIGIPIIVSVLIISFIINRRRKQSPRLDTYGESSIVSPPPSFVEESSPPPPDDDHVLKEERAQALRGIINRYTSIPLEEMVKLLRFPDRYELQRWLISLPEDLTFKIDEGKVIIPQNLQKDSTEAEAAIDRLLSSFEEFEKTGKGKR